MTTVILVIHMMIAAALVILVLLQRSEGGALGMGGGAGGMGGLMSGRSAANLLTRSTGILAGLFMLSSLTLSIMANNTTKQGSLLDKVDDLKPVIPVEQPVQKEPSAPLSK